ncbi:unnamed protein product, partial [Prorocentrum cordatum]
ENVDFGSLTKGLCTLAKRVPQVPKGLNKRQTEDATANRTALVKTIDILWKIPQLRQRIWSYADEQVSVLRNEILAPDVDVWPGECKKLSQVTPNWMAAWLKNRKPCWTAPLLSAIGKHQKDNIVHIFQMVCAYYKKDVIPEDCWADPQLFGFLCTERANTVGFPDEAFIRDCVDKATGKIDWIGYPYDYKWTNGKVSKITSYLKDTALPKDFQVIDKRFKIQNAADAVRAVAQLELTKHEILPMFEPGSRIVSLNIDKKGDCLKGQLHAAKRRQEALKKEQAAATSSSSAIDMNADTEETAANKKRKAEVARKAAAKSKSARVQQIDLSKMDAA